MKRLKSIGMFGTMLLLIGCIDSVCYAQVNTNATVRTRLLFDQTIPRDGVALVDTRSAHEIRVVILPDFCDPVSVSLSIVVPASQVGGGSNEAPLEILGSVNCTSRIYEVPGDSIVVRVASGGPNVRVVVYGWP